MTPFEKAVYNSYFECGHRRNASQEESSDACFAKRWQKWLPPNTGTKVLDLGCGEGLWLSKLSSALSYHNLLGVDGSRDLVSRAKARGVPAIQSDIRDFLRAARADSNFFDCVGLFHVLEHFSTEEGYELLELVRKILAPGGHCFIAVPNILCRFSGTPFGDITHKTYFTTASLSQLVWISGFGPPTLIPDVICERSLRSRLRLRLANSLLAMSRLQYAMLNGFGSARTTTFGPEIVCVTSPRVEQ